MECALNCTIFCPTVELPIAPVAMAVGGGAVITQIPVYGTLGFSAEIITNPQMATSLVPVVAQVRFQGNTLVVTSAAPQAGDAGNYDAVVRISNCGGTIDIPIQFQVAP